MRYLLDTNTCIGAMRNAAPIVQRMAAVSPGDCAISTITSYELCKGIEKCANPAKELVKFSLLLTAVHQLVWASPLGSTTWASPDNALQMGSNPITFGA